MLYLGTLFICLFLAFHYDVRGNTKNRQHWYNILLIWFIAVSGFQYMVGVDIVRYVSKYDPYYSTLRFDVADMEGRIQPGWVLLSYCCRQLSDDFLLFKLVQATFVNFAIFSFFKRETRYVFTCVFLYALTSYLLINFNLLRQSFAIGFLLYSISYTKRGRYMLAFLFIGLAFMFHNSAFVGLIYPVFKILKYNRKTFLFISLIAIIGVYVMIRLDYGTLIPYLLDSGLLGENITELAEHHLANDKFAAQDIQIGITRFLQVLVIVPILLYYIQKKRDLFFGGQGFVYLFLIIINYSIPIVFRFRLFFDMAYFVVFATVIIEYPLKRFRQVRGLFFVVLLLFYSYFPYKEYMTRYPGSRYRYIDQYYPYHSIFNPEYDRKKMHFFGL